MGFSNGIGVTGLATSLLFGSGWWGPSSSPSPPSPYTAVEISANGQIFAEWPDGAETDELHCTFWNGSFYYAPSACDTFSVSRISTTTAQTAIDRAVRCAALHDTDCVLSGEIGFSVPAAFIYDATAGFRILLAPRLLALSDTDEAAKNAETQVRIQDPTGSNPNFLHRLNKSILVEYLAGGSREVRTERLEGPDAYCVQMLRASILPACWGSLD